jgi:hypothetical protein
MEAICFSETSVDVQRSTQHYIPEDSAFYAIGLYRFLITLVSKTEEDKEYYIEECFNQGWILFRNVVGASINFLYSYHYTANRSIFVMMVNL